MTKEMLEKIKEKFNKYQNSLVLQQADLSLKSISDMVTSEAININPEYQRRKRWTSKKESDLIESFILNIPVPPIYLAEDVYGTYSVIDGKQRITAIHNFLSGKLKLEKVEKFKEIDGFYFEDLPDNIKNALSIRPYLRVVTLLNQSDKNLKYEVFLRLNKAGVPLNSQEIRNVAFMGDFNSLLLTLSENNNFKKILKIKNDSKIYKEMIDIQFVLRFFTIKEKWKKFPNNMDVAMDDFMKNNYQKNQQQVDKFELDFNRAFDACLSIWGDKTFLKPNGTKQVLQGFYDIQMVCLSLLNDVQLAKAIADKEKVQKLLENEVNKNDKFSKALTQFTSNTKNVKYRIETFLNLLKAL
jgi:hypothetical protein